MMAAAHLVATGRPVRLRYALGWYAGRGLRLAMWASIGVLAAAAIVPIVLVATDHQAMVVSSDAMQPEISSGDVIVNESISPSAVTVGDIVTYSDSMRAGVLITERVVEVTHDGSLYWLTTKADVGSTQERWSIDEQGRVGRVSYQVPRLGSALAVTTAPAVRLALLAGVILLLGTMARRYFSS